MKMVKIKIKRVRINKEIKVIKIKTKKMIKIKN